MKTSATNKRVLLWLVMSLLFVLSACTKTDSPKGVSDQFWKAVLEKDMETAKLYATWDTVGYLKYLKTEKLHPERFQLGEEMLGKTRSEVETVLFTSKLGKTGVKVPGVTVLVMTNQGWRVNVKKTMTSVIKYTANNVVDQLNGLMEESIKELDSTLSESIDDLGKSLQENAEELKRELLRPIFPRKEKLPDSKHKGQEI